jgi:hypothetical protein
MSRTRGTPRFHVGQLLWVARSKRSPSDSWTYSSGLGVLEEAPPGV